MSLLEELYSLYEKNVNGPNRKRTLNAISNHPSANLLAELVFKRMDRADYLFAKNELLPNDGDEYGAFDHLLGEHQCDWILELMNREDYVISLLKDEFRVKYDREPSCLSDIVKIAADREQMIESPVAKAAFETKYCHLELGSNWIVTHHIINGVDEQERVGTFPYVYKIVRSEEIRLERIRLSNGYPRRVGFFLFEPFLIIFDREKRIDVFNLLEPSEQPRSLGGEGQLIEPQGYYEADLRHNGKLLDSLIFPIVRKVDARAILVEFAVIRRTSVNIISTETITLPEEYAHEELLLLDRDNLLLRIYLREDENDDVHGCLAFRIIPSKKKVISFSLPKLSGIAEFGMVEKRVGMTVWDTSLDEYDDDNTRINFFAFGFLSEESGFEVICFVKLLHGQLLILRDDTLIQYNDGESKDIIVWVDLLIDHLEKMGPAMPSLTREVNGVQVTRPIVVIEKLLAENVSEEMVTTGSSCVNGSRIGRAVGEPSDDEATDLMEIQIFV